MPDVFIDFQLPLIGGGGQGAGTREKWGREVYGKQEKTGQETGYPKGQELGETGNEFCNIAQYLNGKGMQR